MGVSKLLLLAWITAVVAVAGSLFLSEVMGFLPCNLCWWQRVAMFPLPVLLTIGILRRDTNVVWYVLPLAVAGMILASYHELIQLKLIPEAQSCALGVSCSTRDINLLGFITIPVLSLVAFTTIAICSFLEARREQ